MPALKFEIKRKCEVCGSIFVAKTLDSKCCSEKCIKVAWKRRKDEEKKQERLKAIADQVPDYRDYISIPEAVAMYGKRTCIDTYANHFGCKDTKIKSVDSKNLSN